MREIVLDTETTGLDPRTGHRLIEIACVELEDFLPTGRTFHRYMHPDRPIDPDAERVPWPLSLELSIHVPFPSLLSLFSAALKGRFLWRRQMDEDACVHVAHHYPHVLPHHLLGVYYLIVGSLVLVQGH